MSTDWKTIFYSPLEKGGKEYWPDRIDRMALKRYCSLTDAEEAAADVIKSVTHNDFEKLCKINPLDLDIPAAYLMRVVTNAFADYSIKRFGRCRPPKRIIDMGKLWQDIFKWLCCYRYSVEEIADHVSNEARDSAEGVFAKASIIRVIHPRCGEGIWRDGQGGGVNTPPEEPDEGESEPDGDIRGPSGDIEGEEWKKIIAAVGGILGTSDFPLTEEPQRKRVKFPKLEPVEILILRLTFVENYPISVTARLLQLTPYKADKILNETLRKLRKTLKEAGVEKEWLVHVGED